MRGLFTLPDIDATVDAVVLEATRLAQDEADDDGDGGAGARLPPLAARAPEPNARALDGADAPPRRIIGPFKKAAPAAAPEAPETNGGAALPAISGVSHGEAGASPEEPLLPSIVAGGRGMVAVGSSDFAL
jgi:hypothetical protein